jgi:hypothetical protein
VRQIEFEKAIEVGEEKTPVEICGELIAGGECNSDLFATKFVFLTLICFGEPSQTMYWQGY